MPQHSYGYIKDKKDIRDYAYKAAFPKAVAVPDQIDLRPLCSPVRDQGQLGSCTGFAMATGVREFLENSVGSRNDPFEILSPLFLYYEERVLEGTVNIDSGAELRDGMKVLEKMGCATEITWPYLISKFTNEPPVEAYDSAQHYKITSYHRLGTLAEAQDCLANGNAFAIGFYVYESFESDVVATTGKMPMPDPNERILGGHAVFVVGYKVDASWPGGGYLIVKNSWGTGWGDKGYFYMPFAYFIPEYVPDIWVALITTEPPPPPPGDVPTISSFSPTSGLPLSGVDIFGTGLTLTKEVLFNGVKSPAVQLTADGQLTVSVPKDATTGPITIVTSNGTITTSDVFTVIQAPSGCSPVAMLKRAYDSVVSVLR